MRLLYVDADAPYGCGASFVNTELRALKERDIEILIAPRDLHKSYFKEDVKDLENSTLKYPIINVKILIYFIYKLLTDKRVREISRLIIKNSRNYKILSKNLFVLPKGVFLSFLLKDKKIEHIHSHWGSTPSTIGLIISFLLNIPLSITFHRFDILENNLARFKAMHSSFIRCISKNGRDELQTLINLENIYKLKLIHMGVFTSKNINSNSYIKSNFLKIGVPANLIPVKGHRYLIEAFGFLVKKGITSFKCYFFGKGYLHKYLQILIEKFQLEEYVLIKGQIPHSELLNLYKSRNIDAIILPSIIDECGNKEGIPVSLMEAMAYGIPVISTNTGGIPELIGDGSGIMVNQKDPIALADAIEKLMKDSEYYKTIAEKGRKKVEDEFNVNKIAQELLNLFEINKKVN